MATRSRLQSPRRRALVIVDVQNDFCEGGALEVPNGSEVVEMICSLRARLGPSFFEAGIFATQDWHPKDHSSFAASHAGREQFSSIDLGYGEQTLWPVHCVQGSRGADFAEGLELDGVVVVRKGTDVKFDSYSGFEDNAGMKHTELEQLLRDSHATDVYICGLATDYCVKFTALRAADRSFNTFLLEDACVRCPKRTGLSRPESTCSAPEARKCIRWRGW